MKTRDRILHTSLALFNTEGEPATTTVDIANEMDISPGNLYYHFKGKDSIIGELFNQLEVGLGEILSAPVETPLSIEDNWYYLYVVFEEIYQYRFFYENLANLLERYPDLARRFSRLLQMKRAALRAVWETLAGDAAADCDEQETQALVENMVLVLNYWLSHERLSHGEQAPELVIHRGVFQLMVMIAPYLGPQQRDFYYQLQEIYRAITTPSGAG
jgi:AcrR family transcriptional regulator